VAAIALATVLVFFAVGYYARGGGSEPAGPAGLGGASVTTSPRGTGAVDTPRSSLAGVAVADLPVEGRATLALIDRGGPFPYAQDGSVFGNLEGHLPRRARGYYREYTVPTPGARDRGARRLIAGRSGDLYYTDDHYASFRQVLR
jgi:ribonuclease T1